MTETTISNEFTEPEYTRIKKDYTINLVWHQISNMDSNYALSSDIESMTGVNTISPTWFSVSSKDGTVSSLADSSYVETAHEKGLEVWGLVDNFNQEVDMKEVLTNTTAREKLTTQLIEAALEYQLDGLNIDFENLGEELGDAYIESSVNSPFSAERITWYSPQTIRFRETSALTISAQSRQRSWITSLLWATTSTM